MKNTFAKIGSILFVIVMSVSVICSCNQKEDVANETETMKGTVTENAITIEDVSVENGTFAPIEVTGLETIDIESAWDELCEGMTPEEIVSVEKEFADLGMSKEDVVALLYS